ncbi:hypothetical protein VNO77_04007 [Canavalia gladiata]|uniref:Uncharacterized protein n=1 Tax=Canavalia gladiata TaxID=3824 RepID=A0AAN9MVS7_CANGL
MLGTQFRLQTHLGIVYGLTFVSWTSETQPQQEQGATESFQITTPNSWESSMHSHAGHKGHLKTKLWFCDP